MTPALALFLGLAAIFLILGVTCLLDKALGRVWPAQFGGLFSARRGVIPEAGNADLPGREWDVQTVSVVGSLVTIVPVNLEKTLLMVLVPRDVGSKAKDPATEMTLVIRTPKES